MKANEHFRQDHLNEKMADADKWKQWQTTDHVPFVSTPEEMSWFIPFKPR